MQQVAMYGSVVAKIIGAAVYVLKVGDNLAYNQSAIISTHLT